MVQTCVTIPLLAGGWLHSGKVVESGLLSLEAGKGRHVRVIHVRMMNVTIDCRHVQGRVDIQRGASTGMESFTDVIV